MHRYRFQIEKVINRDIQSKFLETHCMSVPRMKSVSLQIPVPSNKEILPAMAALELISGNKSKLAFSKIDKRVSSVHTTLRANTMYTFLDNLTNIYIPIIKQADTLGETTLSRDYNQFNIEQLLLAKTTPAVVIPSINTVLAVEREYLRFSKVFLSLQIVVDRTNPLSDYYVYPEDWDLDYVNMKEIHNVKYVDPDAPEFTEEELAELHVEDSSIDIDEETLSK